MLACCGFVTNYCCSALGTVSSKFTSIMNLENLDTRKLKAACSEIPTCDVSCDCHVLSSHLKEADYKCGYVLISFVSLQCADLPKVQNFLVVGDNVFEAPPHSETMWLLFTLAYPHRKVWRTLLMATCTKNFTKMLWGRKQSYLYIWKYLNLIRFSVINLSVGGALCQPWATKHIDEGTTEKCNGSSSPFTRLTAYSTFCPSQAHEHNSK